MPTDSEGRSLLRNVTAALGGETIQAGLSVVIFFGLFFQLSDQDWGLYVAATTTGLILGTLMNLGSQELLVRNVSRGASLDIEWGQTLLTQIIGAVVGVLIGLAVRPIFFEDLPLRTTLILMVLNISFFWKVESTVRIGQAVKRLNIGTRGRFYFALGRLAAVGAFALSGSSDVNVYALFALPLTAIGTVAALVATGRATDTKPRLALPDRERLIRGLPFVGTSGAQDLLAGFDRPLLSANGFVVETGQYGIADRLLRISSIPTMALVRATSADFFQVGEARDHRSFALAVRFARPAIAYGVLVSVAVAIGSLIVRGFVPDRFEPVLPMLLLLSALPALHASQFFPANLLTGTDRQGTRLVLYLIAVAINVSLNLLWIPTFSWRGAAVATLIAEATLAVMLWLVAWRVTKNG